MITLKYPFMDLIIREIQILIKNTLGPELLGLYLFGSLVGGDFDPATSDIDLLAITGSIVSKTQLSQLADMHAKFAKQYPEWKNHVEVAYVSVDAMRDFKTNTSQIARISPGEPLHYRDMNIAWLMDWYMVQEMGVILEGPAPRTFIPKISGEEFVKSLKNEYPSWLERAKEARWVGYQSYIILSLCRGMYAIRFGKQVSKFKGAAWAMHEYPQWAELIKLAIDWHGSADKSDSTETQVQTIKFAEYMLGISLA